MQSARLNLFQRLVRQWDTLHPYNAAQILKIEGVPDAQAMSTAWHEALASLGLGPLRLSGSRFRYESPNGHPSGQPVLVLPVGTRLDQFVSQQLNTPFDPDDPSPFRPFLLQQPDGYYAGLVYQHWVADSVSIRLLLREWFVRRYDPAAVRNRPVRVAKGGYWRFFSPQRAGWELGEGFLSSVRWSSRFKRVRRLEGAEFSDFRVRFSLHHAPHDGWISCLHKAARQRGVTLNDLFLTAIAEACNRHVPVQATPNRQDLALGTIVDLRPHSGEDLSDTFGLFLGFTSVVCRPQDLKDFDRLLQCVSSQSALHKQTGVPQSSPVRMLAGLVAGRMLSRDGVVTFYRKRVPLAGGISNVNLNRSWAAKYQPRPLLEYIRVSPTGPMMPLVFTTSTLGEAFHFGLTRRASVIDDRRASAIASDFMDRLTQVAKT